MLKGTKFVVIFMATLGNGLTLHVPREWRNLEWSGVDAQRLGLIQGPVARASNRVQCWEVGG